jgi:chorismate synthase
MAQLSCVTAGESHGPAVSALVTGMPSGLAIDLDFINHELRRRQGGYGRGARQRIEHDEVTVLAGVRHGMTTGGPLLLVIHNNDARLDDAERTPGMFRPRPGHADLAGAIKHLTTDCRNISERASARETAARTAAGAVARLLLREFGVETFGYVRGMMDVDAPLDVSLEKLEALRTARDQSEVYCHDATASQRMIEIIHRAKTEQDTVGGFAEVHVLNVPIGIGSNAQWDAKLDARLGGAVMSIQAFKAVEIGLGAACGRRFGSHVHDAIEYNFRGRETARHGGSSTSVGFTRPTNHAGGIEGGMSNGMPIVVRGTMKPISTLLQGMPSVDLRTGAPGMSDHERSDICALPAASVVMEHVVAFEIARAMRDKFAGDSLIEMRAQVEAYLTLTRSLISHQ